MRLFTRIFLPAAVLVFSSACFAADCPEGDVDGDCKVGWGDAQVMAGLWLDPNCLVSDCAADIDEIQGVNFGDFVLMAQNWLEDYTRIVHIKWLGHASFRIQHLDTVIYIDPDNLAESPHDANFVLVTHSHGDHYSKTDISKVAKAGTLFIAPPDVVANYGSGQTIAPGETIDLGSVRIIGVAAYNISTTYHQKSKNWVGFIIELGGLRIYNAGDTDLTDEMKALTDIDVAILPIGGKYTMDATEAAEATGYINPALALPAHRRSADPQDFADNAHCDVIIMNVGETIIFGP